VILHKEADITLLHSHIDKGDNGLPARRYQVYTNVAGIVIFRIPLGKFIKCSLHYAVENHRY